MLIKISNLFDITINDLVERPLKSIVKDFESIINVEPDVVTNALKTFSDNDLVIATKGCSPTLCDFICRLFPSIDFEKQRAQMGSIRINIIEDIHNAILERVNIDVISMFNRNRSENANP
jgi:flagellar motor switch protein FliG